MSRKQTWGDDLEHWAEIADGLCKIRMAQQWGIEFADRFKIFLTKEDQMELMSLNAKYASIYWRSWEKLVQKIRGL